MIECVDVRKRIGRQAVLDGIDLTVRRGERVALVGPNGAGKTTLLRCMLGLASFSGSILIAGDRPPAPTARSRLVYVPQRPPRFDTSLGDFLQWFAELRGVPASRIEDVASEFELDLSTHGSKPLAGLSGGMLQKAVLSLALASDAEALLLDEPTANLDAAARDVLLRHLSGMEEGRTLVMCSHRSSEIVAVADRTVGLRAGRLDRDARVARGATADVSRRWAAGFAS